MNKSGAIRQLAAEGMAIAEIARQLGIRYQHAYKVCRAAGLQPSGVERCKAETESKPKLAVSTLLSGGFVSAGCWSDGDAGLSCPAQLPKENGVYAFSIDGQVRYVGVASRSLAQRLYFYRKPGKSQRTNIRLNALIRDALATGKTVEIHYACPPSLNWNGFTISGAEGLEAGLIRDFQLPWNSKGT